LSKENPKKKAIVVLRVVLNKSSDLWYTTQKNEFPADKQEVVINFSGSYFKAVYHQTTQSFVLAQAPYSSFIAGQRDIIWRPSES
jgi:hypothetical protein